MPVLRALVLALSVLALGGCGGEETDHGEPQATPTHTGTVEREIAP